MRTSFPFLIFMMAVFGQTENQDALLARQLDQQAIKLRTVSDVDPITLRAVEHAEMAGDALLLARCLHNRAMILRELHRYDDAEPIHRRVLSLLESNKSTPHSIAMALQSLASLLFYKHRHAEAEHLLLRAVRFPLRNDSPLVLTLVLNTLGQVQYALGKDRDAESSFKRALSVHASIKTSPSDEEFRYTLVAGETVENLLALILNNQGLVAFRLGQLSQAEACWRRSIALYKRATTSPSVTIAAPMANLGEILRFQKRYAESAEQISQALSIFEVTLGPESYRVALVLNLLGNTLVGSGDLAQARRLYNRSLVIMRKLGGAENSVTGVTLSNLAELHALEGTNSRALELYASGLEILEKSLGPAHPTLIPTLTGQAILLRKVGRAKEAKLAEARRNDIQASASKSSFVSLEDLQRGR